MTKKTIEGESTTATVMTDQYDENCYDQIQEMVNHEAFENPVAIMPDTHYGAGAVIGFTMPIGNRVVPNTVGVDIGCGMTALNLGQPEWLEDPGEGRYEALNARIRGMVPMGRQVYNFSEQDYHIVDDFPWDRCQNILEGFVENQEWIEPEWIEDFEGYGKDYFDNVCQRVEYDPKRVINSLGTLGGGNHFIEIARSSKDGDYWVVVHSGSRGIGLTIAKYWQEEATARTTSRKNLSDVPEEHRQYLKSNWKPHAKAIRDNFEGEKIQQKFDEISRIIQKYGPNADSRNNDLDWLEGEEAIGYFIDMIFAQQYARESRKKMVQTVAEIIHDGKDPDEKYGMIDSIHNYVDFRDGVIRKGATRAHAGEHLIIPFNMRDGTIVCEGQGNSEWNHSAPHGAGRRMSRSQAFDELSLDEFEETMDEVFSTSVNEETLDEAPMAYKDTAVVESVIEETAEIIDRWEPIINIKADE